MSFKGKLSRSGSQNSRHSATQDDEPYFNAEDSTAHVEPNIEGSNTYDDPDVEQTYGDCKHLQFTQNHPLGAIFLKLVADTTSLAKKANVKTMDTNVPELCTAFYNGMNFERNSVNSKITQSSSEIENTILNRELNAHRQNVAIEPPCNFSPRPVLTTQSRISEATRAFPHRTAKFNGSNKDGAMSVIEFLISLKRSQEQYPLSEKEFLDKLLDASTGHAHELIMDWMANEESAANIFYSLLLNFDKRTTPEEAKRQLAIYITPKHGSLAKTVSYIMTLAMRASSAFPAGESQKSYYNLEACHALIRALPPYSNQIVSNLYNQLSARFGRTTTFTELSRGVFVYAAAIDNDIKVHGTDGIQRSRSFNGKAVPQKPRYKTFSVSSSTNYGLASQSQGNLTSNRSFTPGHNNRYGSSGALNKGNDKSHNTTGRSNNNGKPYNSNGARPKQRFPADRKSLAQSCSLCGMSNHIAETCKNMRDDSGKILGVIPTYGTCDNCPKNLTTRLHHPPNVCPYRKGGPFENRKH